MVGWVGSECPSSSALIVVLSSNKEEVLSLPTRDAITEDWQNRRTKQRVVARFQASFPSFSQGHCIFSQCSMVLLAIKKRPIPGMAKRRTESNKRYNHSYKFHSHFTCGLFALGPFARFFPKSTSSNFFQPTSAFSYVPLLIIIGGTLIRTISTNLSVSKHNY